MTDDLRDRLTTALMDAMGCQPDVSQESRLWAGGEFCATHDRLGWPCGAVVDTADALLPFVRDEVADALDAAAADAASIHCGYPNAPQIRSLAAVRRWLRARAEEVRRG